MEHQVPLLTDNFWSENYSSELHAPTVLQRIRAELSQGRPTPITVEEAFDLAEQKLNLHDRIFEEGEVGRPLSVIAAVWGHVVYGMPNDRARSFGGFVGSKAGGDVVLGPPADRMEKAACQLFQQHLGRSHSLGPEATTRLVNEVIALYRR